MEYFQKHISALSIIVENKMLLSGLMLFEELSNQIRYLRSIGTYDNELIAQLHEAVRMDNKFFTQTDDETINHYYNLLGIDNHGSSI